MTDDSTEQERMDAGLLLLRIGLGLMFIFVHGGPKLLGGPERWEKIGAAMSHLGIGFAPIFWGFLASCAECLGGFCLLFGFWTRPAAFFMALTMTVAAIMHLSQGDGLSRASHAIEAGIVFYSLILIGAGRYGLDQKRRPQRGEGRYTLP